MLTGVWYDCIDVTELLYQHLKENEWFYNTDTQQPAGEPTVAEDAKLYARISHCKRLLFTSTVCWGSVLLGCHECLVNCHHDNIYYTSYFINYAKVGFLQ